MSSESNMEFRNTYIYVKQPSDYQITSETNNRFWSELAEFASKHQCRKVLVEGPAPKRRLDTVEAFDSGNKAAQSVAGLSIAFCLYDYVPDPLTKFFKTVARNRGAKIEFFTDNQQALKWLEIDPDKQSEKE